MEWMKILAQFGVPSTIALFLVWWIATKLSQQIDVLSKHIEQNTNTLIMLTTIIAQERNIDLEEVKKAFRGDPYEKA